jgi:hypothetical protein
VTPDSVGEPQKTITCILPKGRGRALVEYLVREKQLTAVDAHFARGVGRITPLRHRGVGETSEREVVTVAVPAKDADALFEEIYRVADINRPHGGLMYMQALRVGTPFVLPSGLSEEP